MYRARLDLDCQSVTGDVGEQVVAKATRNGVQSEAAAMLRSQLQTLTESARQTCADSRLSGSQVEMDNTLEGPGYAVRVVFSTRKPSLLKRLRAALS